jgi:hypothetical protein
VSGDAATGDDEENQLAVVFDSPEQEAQKFYVYLWISEKHFLQGICQFLEIVAASS